MPWAVDSTTSSPGLVDDHVDQLVALAELDGDDAALAAAGCSASSGVFFTSPLARGHHQEMVGLVEIADGPAIGDPLALRRS